MRISLVALGALGLLGGAARADYNPMVSWRGSAFATSGSLDPAPTPTIVVAPIPAATPAPAPAPIVADAFLNMGAGPFAHSDYLADADPRPWYQGVAVARLFGGRIDARERDDFAQLVRDRVVDVYARSGLTLDLTLDSSLRSAHEVSVISGAKNPSSPDAVGSAYPGHGAVTYIDQMARLGSVDQLGWAVANNAAHELMHAFGVAEHPDASGHYLDAGYVSWEVLGSPSARFSPAAVAELAARDFHAIGYSAVYPGESARGFTFFGPIGPANLTAVPEPGGLVLAGSGLGIAALVLTRRGRTASHLRS